MRKVRKNLTEDRLSIVIVTWNCASFIKGCLNSLVKEAKEIDHEIIVVDNNSSDKTTDIVKNNYPKITLIKNKENRGFGAANNQGIKISTGNFILLLNPDTIIHPQAIKKMIRFLKKEGRAGMVGPEQLDGEGKIIQNFSRTTPRGALEFLIENLIPRSGITRLLRTPYKVQYLNGGCWLIKKEVLDRAGLFDESLFLYGEEPDMCSRIRKAGWEIFFLRNAVITHFREKSIGQIKKKEQALHFTESYLKLAKKSLKTKKKKVKK